MKRKKTFLLFLAASAFLPGLCLAATDTTGYSYPLLEGVPGFANAGQTIDFPAYLSAIYKFGLWTIGLAALLMLTIGGFMYITSAGNNSRTSTAKKIIGDSIVGVILALVAYLLLYTINPDLVKFTALTALPTSSTGSASGQSAQQAGGSGGAGNGTCSPPSDSSNSCSVSHLSNTCFSSNAAQAGSICNKESNATSIPSGVDICADGNPASYGLFQINLTDHSVGGYPCAQAFSGGAYTAQNHNCRVVNQTLYNECVAAAKNPANNIAVACQISHNGRDWGQWGANTSCGFNK